MTLVHPTSKLLPTSLPTMVLPYAPSDWERPLYLKRRPGILHIASIISFSCLMVSQWKFALQHPNLYIYTVLFGFTILWYLTSLTVNFWTPGFNLGAHDSKVTNWQSDREKDGNYPSIDVMLPFCNEPFEVLKNTWKHVAVMVFAYPGKMTVYCLDDGKEARAEAKEHAIELGFTYLRRPSREGKKAGNLRYAFACSSGEYMMVFDADFCPRPNMPIEMLPYFSHPEKQIGIVQTPQYFRVRPEQAWLEQAAGAVQELFYRMIQWSRNTHWGAICVGTNAMYQREALEAVGGPTLIEHSEDVHTGFDAMGRGWSLFYLPLNLAMGTCPDTLPSFLSQQYRWCMGSMSLLTSKKFWKQPMPLRRRLCFMSGFMYYIHTAVFTFVLPTIPLVLLVFLPELVLLKNYAWILPSMAYSFFIFPMWHRQKHGFGVLAVKHIYGWAHFFAIIDRLRGRGKEWVATGNRSKKTPLLQQFTAGAILWSGSTALAWIALALWRMTSHHWLDFLPMLVSGVLYAAVVIQCFLPSRTRSLV